jgi:hypothetical protein
MIVLFGSTTIINAQKKERPNCGRSVYEILDRYFEGAEVTPDQIINNTADPGRWESKIQTIKVGDHTVKWIDEVTDLSAKSRVEIDGNTIAFEGRYSTNEADENGKISIENSSGEWRQIKLYDLYPKQFITITMNSKICTGLSCGLATQLIYDTSSKKASFFGTFRTDWDVHFFRFTGEVEYFYLSKKFEGDAHGEDKASITYNLYKLLPDGSLEAQKDKKGAAYFIKHTYFPEIWDSKASRSYPAAKTDILTQNWIEPVGY